MKQYSIIFLIAFMAVTLGVWAEPDQTFGEKFTLTDSTKISKLLDKPDTHLGKTVKVEGAILDVCPKAGCWMELAGDNKDKKLRVKVKDGVMVFPMTAKGKHAVVEGSLYKIELTKEQNVGWQKHMAEEKGEKFDSSTVKEGAILYWLKPTSVLIKDK